MKIYRAGDLLVKRILEKSEYLTPGRQEIFRAAAPGRQIRADTMKAFSNPHFLSPWAPSMVSNTYKYKIIICAQHDYAVVNGVEIACKS
jgi:transcriptional antiterminator Rof (Rho-off)